MPIIEIRMPAAEKEGTEAALGRWLRAAGEPVTEHEPLVEINTDKVTLEIAAPASGTLREVLKAPGEIIMPGELLGKIETGDKTTGEVGGVSTVEAGELLDPPPTRRISAQKALPSDPPDPLHEGAETGYSPVVRRLLRELDLDPQAIPKVSRGNRLTPADIAAHVSGRPAAKSAIGELSSPAPLTPSEASAPFAGRKVPHTPMRKSIARHMARSVQTAPHVTSVFEADLYNVLADREARKQATSGEAVPSVTAYLIHAALKAIKIVPEVNSKWHDEYLEIFEHVNFGVGTALDTGGLVVPVIRNAHTMDLSSLSQNLRTMTRKARAGKLTQEDMDGGTFTLSNHGVSGSLLAAPIILPHDQAAILGTGKLQKRVIVCESGGRELFRVRPMMYVTLTVDHRVLDGQQTNGFLTAFVAALENPIHA